MGKKRSIISYDKLTIDQKKQILRDFPDGYGNHLTTIMTATGEAQDALIWETDEIIYLVKITKAMARPILEDDDDDDFDDLEIEKLAEIKDEDKDEDVDDDTDDSYDEPADEPSDENDDEE